MSWFNWFKKSQIDTKSSDFQCTASILTDEKSFYHQFSQDLLEAKQEIIIESPYITIPRMRNLKSFFESLVNRGVAVFIITRHPEEHDSFMAEQSEAGIQYFEKLGIQVLLCKSHHRKLAMIDRTIVWKGSLNILSHRNTREFMEREENKHKAEALFSFLKYDQVSYIKKHLLY
jgi:hypothetical protein